MIQHWDGVDVVMVCREGYGRTAKTDARLCLIEKLMVQLRDGRKLIGVLRSWDQFGEQTFTRLHNTRGRRS
jgi:hypothetical protein